MYIYLYIYIYIYMHIYIYINIYIYIQTHTHRVHFCDLKSTFRSFEMAELFSKTWMSLFRHANQFCEEPLHVSCVHEPSSSSSLLSSLELSEIRVCEPFICALLMHEAWLVDASRGMGQILATLRFYLTENVFQVVLQKSIPTQIRQLILCISNSKG